MHSLNRILAFDALTCTLMGTVLAVSSGPLSGLLSLPQNLLFYAGLLLFPFAAFMAVLSRQAEPWRAGIWLVILGNAGWVLASLIVLVIASPNMLGVGFVVIQTIVVVVLALAELKSLHRAGASLA